MGIPKIRRNLLKYFSNHIIEKDNGAEGECSALYIDTNSLIYKALSFQTKEEIPPALYDKYITIAIELISQVIKAYLPSELLYIAIDGAPPMAKIQHQKESRYSKGASMKYADDFAPSFMITPGTEFMFKLDEAIQNRIVNNKEIFGVKAVVYSSHLVPGEGEHKIMSYIRKNKEKIDKYEDSNVLYGDDSDLILLGLASRLKNLYVCRETVQLKIGYEKTLKKLMKPIHVDTLAKAIKQDLGKKMIKQFIYACSVLGNDFLPKFPSLCRMSDAFPFVMECLKKANGSLGIEKSHKFFKYLCRGETFENNKPATLGSIEELRKTKTKVEEMDGSKFLQFQSRILETMSGYDLSSVKDPSKTMLDMFRILWYQDEFTVFSKKDLPLIMNMCTEYIRGLNWVYYYYISGQDSVTWLWYYPFRRAPLLYDLYMTMKASTEGLFTNYDEIVLHTVSQLDGESRFTCLHQMLSIMPRQAIRYIPEELHVFYLSSSPLLHLIPVNVVEDTDFCENSYNKKIIVPFANYDLVSYTLGKHLFEKAFLSKYTEKRDISNANSLPSNVLEAFRLKRERKVKERSITEESARDNRDTEEAEKKTQEKTHSREEEERKPREKTSSGGYRGRGSFREESGSSRGGYRGRGGFHEEGGSSRGGYRGSSFRGERGGYRGSFRGYRGGQTYRGGRGEYHHPKDL